MNFGQYLYRLPNFHLKRKRGDTSWMLNEVHPLHHPHEVHQQTHILAKTIVHYTTTMEKSQEPI
jgi:hypothetical protein